MVKNILTVLSGAVLAMAIGMIGLPVLARLYDPADFGRFQIYVSIINVLLMLVAFRYELGLLSAEPGKDYTSLLGAALRLCVLTSGAVLIVTALGHPWLSERFPEASVVMWCLGPGLLIAGVFQTVTFLPMRYRDYRVSAEYKIVQSRSFVGISLAVALLPLPGIGLIFGDVAARGLAAWRILSRAPRGELQAARETSRHESVDALKRHVTLPMFTLPGTLISAIAAALVPFAFASLFDLNVAGQYSLVERFVITPVGAVGIALYQVYTGELSHSIREQPTEVLRKFRRLVRWTVAVAVAGACVGWLVLPTLFPLLFGARWTLAGELAAVAMPMVAVGFVVTPINMVLQIAKARKTQLGWEVFRAIAMGATFWWLHEHPELSPVEVMTIYAWVVTAVYIIYLLLADHALRQLKAGNAR
jgi:O-antigen/teichoic acid export membrane protein